MEIQSLGIILVLAANTTIPNTAIARTIDVTGPNSGTVVLPADSEEPVNGSSDVDEEEPIDGDSDAADEEPVDGGPEEPVDGGSLAAKVDGIIVRIALRVKTPNSAATYFDFIATSNNL